MLTKEEEALFAALKEQLPEDEWNALNELSEAEKKEFVAEARKEAEKEIAKPKTKLRMMSEMSFGDFVTSYGGKSLIQAILVWLPVKQSGGSWLLLFFFIILDLVIAVALVLIAIVLFALLS